MIFFENRQKNYFFKTSGKNFVTSNMKQNPSSCSIGIWNYHLAASKSKSRIFPGPYPSPLCSCCNELWFRWSIQPLRKLDSGLSCSWWLQKMRNVHCIGAFLYQCEVCIPTMSTPSMTICSLEHRRHWIMTSAAETWQCHKHWGSFEYDY